MLRIIEIVFGSSDVGGRDIYQGDCKDTGDTPLAFAADRGYPEVVEMLRMRGDANTDKPNNHGLKPLWCCYREWV